MTTSLPAFHSETCAFCRTFDPMTVQWYDGNRAAVEACPACAAVHGLHPVDPGTDPADA